ncbi:MAG: hypothetical protein ACFFCS_02475 [Candidatus Hodarchaeota archaeon]
MTKPKRELEIDEDNVPDKYKLNDTITKWAFFLGMISRMQCRVLRIIDNEKTVKELELDEEQRKTLDRLVKSKIVKVKEKEPD